MRMAGRIAARVATVALSVAGPLAQAAQQKPSFDVISIKPSAPLGTGPIRIGGGTQGDRFTMTYTVVSLTRNILVAEGTGIIVSFDYAAGKKTGLPSAVRTAIQSIQGSEAR